MHACYCGLCVKVRAWNVHVCHMHIYTRCVSLCKSGHIYNVCTLYTEARVLPRVCKAWQTGKHTCMFERMHVNHSIKQPHEPHAKQLKHSGSPDRKSKSSQQNTRCFGHATRGMPPRFMSLVARNVFRAFDSLQLRPYMDGARATRHAHIARHACFPWQR